MLYDRNRKSFFPRMLDQRDIELHCHVLSCFCWLSSNFNSQIRYCMACSTSTQEVQCTNVFIQCHRIHLGSSDICHSAPVLTQSHTNNQENNRHKQTWKTKTKYGHLLASKKVNSQYSKLSADCKLSKAAVNTVGTLLIYQTTYLEKTLNVPTGTPAPTFEAVAGLQPKGN